MATIKPFKGIRFNSSIAGDPGKVITPPYDVIDSDGQEQLHQNSPYNIIRLEYGRTNPGDNETENRYTRAADTLNQWLKDKVLRPDGEYCYYLYEQGFSFKKREYKRRGIVAALKVEPYINKIVLPHELTMSGPKADRFQLLDSIRTNTSPIFTLFPDPESRVDAIFARAADKPPVIDTREPSGQEHRLWIISDPELIVEISEYLQPRPLLIADGHHRYETALKYSTRQDKVGNPAESYVLTIMVSMQDPGLLILPTHRLLSGLSTAQIKELNRIIEDKFEIDNRGSLKQLDQVKFGDDVATISINKNGFGLFTGEKAAILTPKNSKTGALPVTLLHDLILKPLLAPGGESDIDKEVISYPHDLESAQSSVLAGAADAAFILHTVPVEEVLEYSQSGKVMPQKTTYFYPKLPGGLVLYNMDLSF